MFTALKNLTGKAEEALEKTKKDIEGLAAEKKQKATELLEAQAKKTGEALLHGKSEIEKTAVGVASDTKKAAIDGFDKEVSETEKKVDEAVKEVMSEFVVFLFNDNRIYFFNKWTWTEFVSNHYKL